MSRVEALSYCYACFGKSIVCKAPYERLLHMQLTLASSACCEKAAGS